MRGAMVGTQVSEGAELHVERLKSALGDLGRVVVAFSGGADSSLLAWVATETLGAPSVLCATAVSPSLAEEELEHCRSLAAQWSLRWTEVSTDELANESYVANGSDRCYHCKSALLDALSPLAANEGAIVTLGVNVDDLGEHRPGQRAAAQRGAKFPLVEAGFTKDLVREASRKLGLRTWDRPAAPCLASRLPYGTPVTLVSLKAVEKAESALRALGFGQLRVRHYGDLARVELEGPEMAAALDRRTEIVEALRSAGYRYVTLDLEGFRSGNLNVAPAAPSSSPVRADGPLR